MSKRTLFTLAVLALFLFGACAIQVDLTSTPPSPQVPTLNTPLPLLFTETPEESTGNVFSPTPPQPTPFLAPLGDDLKMALIALDDNGASGKKIGCNDSVVMVSIPYDPAQEPIQAALDHLLSLRTPYYGESGLYTALSQADLQLAEIAWDGQSLRLRLTGSFMLGGECDNPRVKAQLEETLRQFPQVQQVEIYVNDVPLDEALSLK